MGSIFNIINKKNLSNDVVTVFNKSENFDQNALDKRLYKYIYNDYFFVSGYHKLGLDQIHDFLKIIAKKSYKKHNLATSLISSSVAFSFAYLILFLIVSSNKVVS